MRVQELANRVRIAPHVVRYYARIGLLRPKRDAGNGYRRFGAEDLKRIVFIRQAQRLGFTLTEIRLVLEMSSRGKTPCHTVRAIVQQRIAENAEQLAALQSALSGALQPDYWGIALLSVGALAIGFWFPKTHTIGLPTMPNSKNV